MTNKQWEIFCNFKQTFKNKVEEWQKSAPELCELQRAAAVAAGTPDYPFETTVVYNRDLDKITIDDDIKLIVIGDNPGKDEQLAKNNRYLVGQAGKLADGFFKKNPELQTDFRKNVIILNKTPVHSAKTVQLKKIMKDGGEKIFNLIYESQIWMAEQTAKLHCMLETPELWLVGYSELKPKGFFVPYKEKLKQTYLEQKPAQWDKVFVFKHFSMNCFTSELKKFLSNKTEADRPLIDTLHTIGNLHKGEIF